MVRKWRQRAKKHSDRFAVLGESRWFGVGVVVPTPRGINKEKHTHTLRVNYEEGAAGWF